VERPRTILLAGGDDALVDAIEVRGVNAERTTMEELLVRAAALSPGLIVVFGEEGRARAAELVTATMRVALVVDTPRLGAIPGVSIIPRTSNNAVLAARLTSVLDRPMPAPRLAPTPKPMPAVSAVPKPAAARPARLAPTPVRPIEIPKAAKRTDDVPEENTGNYTPEGLQELVSQAFGGDPPTKKYTTPEPKKLDLPAPRRRPRQATLVGNPAPQLPIEPKIAPKPEPKVEAPIEAKIEAPIEPPPTSTEELEALEPMPASGPEIDVELAEPSGEKVAPSTVELDPELAIVEPIEPAPIEAPPIAAPEIRAPQIEARPHVQAPAPVDVAQGEQGGPAHDPSGERGRETYITPPPPQKKKRSAAPWIALVLLLLLVPIVGGAVWWRFLRTAEAEPRPTPRAALEPAVDPPPVVDPPRVEPRVEPSAQIEPPPPVEPPAEPEVVAAEQDGAEQDGAAQDGAEQDVPPPEIAPAEQAAPPPQPADPSAPLEGREEDFSLTALGITPATRRPRPNELDNLLRSANGNRTREHYDEAAAKFREVLAFDPEHVRATAGLAITHLAGGPPETALLYAQRLVRLRSTSSSFYVVLGDAYRGTGNTDAARRAWEHALELDRDNSTARERLRGP
jgi:hypothetical protein